MATNKQIEAPAFDRIRAGDDNAMEDAVRLLWLAINHLYELDGQHFLTATQILSPFVLHDSPTANQDNYNVKTATVVSFEGGTAFNLTGFRNGVPGRLILVVNLGTGTITVKYEVTSDAANRITTSTSADKTIVTGKSMLFCYLNSRWREVSLV